MKTYMLAAAAVLALTACDQTTLPTAAPEPTPGPVASADSLNGTYNLRASDCLNENSPQTRLVIDGNKFNFHESACTVADVHSDTSITNVTLSCQGEGNTFNRIVRLQSRPGELRMTDDTRTLTYYRCPAVVTPAAAAQTAATVAVNQARAAAVTQ